MISRQQKWQQTKINNNCCRQCGNDKGERKTLLCLNCTKKQSARNKRNLELKKVVYSDEDKE